MFPYAPAGRMAFTLIRLALSNRGQLTILGLLVSLLLPEDTTAIKCLSNIDDKGQVGSTMKVQDCAPWGHQSCFTMNLVDLTGQTVLWTMKGCQNVSVAGLYCLRHVRGISGEGNCFYYGQTKGRWDSEVSRCSGQGESHGEVIPEDQSMKLCTCNDADECNRDCQCDGSYGLCGAKPCPTYKCYCGGGSSANDLHFPNKCSAGGVRVCLGEAESGCYTMSQEGPTELYRDCALPPGVLKCIHGTDQKRLPQTDSPADCVSGTNGDWIQIASQHCLWKDPTSGLYNDDRGARIKACRCTGEYCNRGTISRQPVKNLKGSTPNGAASGEQSTETWLLTLIIGAGARPLV